MAAGDPIKERAYEAARRPERESGAKLLVDLVKKAGKEWPSTKPWLNATHVQRLTELVRMLPFKAGCEKCAGDGHKVAHSSADLLAALLHD